MNKQALNFNFGTPGRKFMGRYTTLLHLRENPSAYSSIDPISRNGVNKLVTDAGYTPARMNTFMARKRLRTRALNKAFGQDYATIDQDINRNVLNSEYNKYPGGWAEKNRVFLNNEYVADPFVQLHEQGHVAADNRTGLSRLWHGIKYAINPLQEEQAANNMARKFINTIQNPEDRKLMQYLYDVSQRGNIAAARTKGIKSWFIPKQTRDKVTRIHDNATDILEAHKDDVKRIFRQLNGLEQ